MADAISLASAAGARLRRSDADALRQATRAEKAEAELSKAIDAIQDEAHRGDELKAEVERLRAALEGTGDPEGDT
jgi:hypothetical protein